MLCGRVTVSTMRRTYEARIVWAFCQQDSDATMSKAKGKPTVLYLIENIDNLCVMI